MSNLLDDLFSGSVSRQTFIEIASKAGLALPMANFALAEVAAQTAPKVQEGQKFSPANIGGSGRLERDFYRDWIKTSKAPMVEGYFLDAKTQEVQPWPDIGGHTFTQGKRQNKFEWAEGSLFSIPMNLVHRHFNSDSAQGGK